MAVRLKWYGPQCRQAVHARLAKNLDEAAEYTEESLAALISVQGPPRSTPGNPPHMDTTELWQSIDHVTDTNALVATVGTDKEYAVYLEMGTSKMAPRPWFLRTLLFIQGALARILAQ